MKKVLAGIVVLIIVIAGVVALTHKSSKPATTASSNTSNSSSTPPVNNSVIITKTSGSLGQYLAEPNGTPLYTYNGDTSGVSNCTGSCLTSWPAYQDKGSTSGLPAGISTIKRTDNGQVQYTYNGLPLYTFVGDSAGGQPTGNNVMNFSIAKPKASGSSNSSAPANSGSSGSSSSQPSNSGNSYNY